MLHVWGTLCSYYLSKTIDCMLLICLYMLVENYYSGFIHRLVYYYEAMPEPVHMLYGYMR